MAFINLLTLFTINSKIFYIITKNILYVHMVNIQC